MNDIIAKLQKDGAYYKFNGIVECVRSQTKDETVISELKKMKSDHAQIAGYSISDFSFAALDVLNAEKYTGNNENVLRIIQSKFAF